MSTNTQNMSQDRESEIIVKPLNSALGAEVICEDVSKIGPKGREKLYQAYLDHLVLVCRRQHLSEDEQLSVSRNFGTLEASATNRDELEASATNRGEGKGRFVVEISNRPSGKLGAGELRWHSDHSYLPRPLGASLLHALVVPSEGGDTYFSNMYMALATLASSLRKRISGLTAKNSLATDSAGGYFGPPIADVRTSDGASHPIVRTHAETGFNLLYIGRRPDAYVNGLSIAESEELLDLLWAHADNLKFAHRHHWEAGDLLIWDNRAVMHRRDAFDATQTRIMRRTQCIGEVPSYDPKADARGVHPRGKL